MFKKFNWGWGIAIVYGSFVLTFIAVLVYSTTQKVDLVNEDYYKSELNYQKRIEAINRTKLISDGIIIDFKDNSMLIQLPFLPEQIKNSTLKLYRPSNSKQDKEYDLNPLLVLHNNSLSNAENNDNLTPQLSKYKIDNINVGKGFWKAQLEWEVNGNKYYKEESMMLN